MTLNCTSAQTERVKTKLPSNLILTSRECVYFRSRDQVGSYTIRSAISENPMLLANFTALYQSSIEPDGSFTLWG